MSPSSESTVSSSLAKLQLSSGDKASEKQAKSEPVDSWEDAADESSDTEAEVPTSAQQYHTETSYAPPSTTILPSFDSRTDVWSPEFSDNKANPSDASKSRDSEKRPEKTTAIASRLIAAGIGQKAPRRTEEQRRYDQAIKMQEKKKRDQAKADEERKKQEKVQAQKDIWED